MTLVDLLLHEIMNLVGWKRNYTTLPYIMLKEVVNLASAAVELADPCFDTGKGYKRFDALMGFFQISFLYVGYLKVRTGKQSRKKHKTEKMCIM